MSKNEYVPYKYNDGLTLEEKEPALLNENLDIDLFLDNKKEESIKQPKITSLDEIQKFSNIFVCVYPFIFYGYRINHTIKDCLFSIFKLHNETMNIWTHLLPFLFFFSLLFIQSTSKIFFR